MITSEDLYKLRARKLKISVTDPLNEKDETFTNYESIVPDIVAQAILSHSISWERELLLTYEEMEIVQQNIKKASNESND